MWLLYLVEEVVLWRRAPGCQKITDMQFHPFQPSAVLCIETSHLFWFVNQMTCFYMKRNTGLKWVNSMTVLDLLITRIIKLLLQYFSFNLSFILSEAVKDLNIYLIHFFLRVSRKFQKDSLRNFLSDRELI